MARKRRTRGAPHANKPAAGSAFDVPIATVVVAASSKFFEAVAKLDHGLTEKPEEPGAAATGGALRTYKLTSWRSRDKALTWFAKGVDADPGARLTFSPDLSKQQREDLHRMRSDRFKKLASQSIGFGDSRSIVFAHADAELGSEQPELTEEQLAAATELYRDLKQAGHNMSLDEVKTRYATNELTDVMASMLQQSDKDQDVLREIMAAIEGGATAKLQAALRGKQQVVKSGLPVRGLGTLPLQAAVCKGSQEMVQLLLDAGAPLGSLDGQGATPLQVARKQEHGDIEGLLLRHGAPTGADDNDWAAQEDEFTVEAEAKRQPKQTISTAPKDTAATAQPANKPAAHEHTGCTSTGGYKGGGGGMRRQDSATSMSRQGSIKGTVARTGKPVRPASTNLDVRQLSQDASAAAQAALDAMQHPGVSSASAVSRAPVPKPRAAKQGAKPGSAGGAASSKSAATTAAVTAKSSSEASTAAAPGAHARECGTEAQSAATAAGGVAAAGSVRGSNASSAQTLAGQTPFAPSGGAARGASVQATQEGSLGAAAASSAETGHLASAAAESCGGQAAPGQSTGSSTGPGVTQAEQVGPETIKAAQHADAVAAAHKVPAREMEFPVHLPVVQQPMAVPQPISGARDAELAPTAQPAAAHSDAAAPQPQQTQQSERHADMAGARSLPQASDAAPPAPMPSQRQLQQSAGADSVAAGAQAAPPARFGGESASTKPQGQDWAANTSRASPAQAGNAAQGHVCAHGKHRITTEDTPSKRSRSNVQNSAGTAQAAASTDGADAPHARNGAARPLTRKHASGGQSAGAAQAASASNATASNNVASTVAQNAASAKPYAAHGSVSIAEIDSNGAVADGDDDDIVSIVSRLSLEYYEKARAMVAERPQAALACAGGMLLGGIFLAQALSRKR